MGNRNDGQTIDMTGKEYTRRARERVEQRESGVMAARHREFALAVAELRD